jgi:DNA-binding MarR family transcriptional regulator
LYDTTVNGPGDPETPGVFPDDELRGLLQQLVRRAGLLEPGHTQHQHGGVHVSASEVFALAELTESGALSQQDLGARLGLEKSTVSRLAAGLAERGWLVRERAAGNRRLYRLNLTDQGREVARRVGEGLKAHHDQLLGSLTGPEREGLRIGLGGLIRVMKDHHPDHEKGR